MIEIIYGSLIPRQVYNIIFKLYLEGIYLFNNQHFHAVYIMCMQPLPDSSQTFTGL